MTKTLETADQEIFSKIGIPNYNDWYQLNWVTKPRTTTDILTNQTAVTGRMI